MQGWQLNPYERLVVRMGNHYTLKGPGKVWVFPLLEEVLTKLYIGVNGQSFEIQALSTSEGILVDAKVQLLHKVEPDLLKNVLFQVVPLSNGGWQTALSWQLESTLRKLIAQYSWQDLNCPTTQKRIERHLCYIVSDGMAAMGVKVVKCCLVHVKLPDDLLAAQLQSAVLKSYTDAFGAEMPQAMSDIARLQLLNSMQQQGRVQVVLTSSDFSNTPSPNAAPYYLTLEQPSLFQTPKGGDLYPIS